MVVFCLYYVKVRFKMLTEFQVPDLNYHRKTVSYEYVAINLMIYRFFSSVKSFHLSVRVTFKIQCDIFRSFVHTYMTSALGYYNGFARKSFVLYYR